MPAATSAPKATQEDDQRQRDRVEPGSLQVVLERRLQLLVGALAERADVEVGMRLLHLGDAGDDGVDLVRRRPRKARGSRSGRAPSACRLRRTAAVLGVEGRLDLRHRVERSRRRLITACTAALNGGVVRRQRLALDQNLFAGGLLEVLVEDRVRPPRLARPGRVGDDRLHRRDDADREQHDREREPAEDRLLPMVGAPARHPGGEVRPTRGARLGSADASCDRRPRPARPG